MDILTHDIYRTEHEVRTCRSSLNDVSRDSLTRSYGNVQIDDRPWRSTHERTENSLLRVSGVYDHAPTIPRPIPGHVALIGTD